MSKETAEVLKKAKALIDAPEKWIKGAYAGTRTGDSVKRYWDGSRIEVRDGNCFCSLGALARATDTSPGEAEKSEAAVALAKAISPADLLHNRLSAADVVTRFNDAQIYGHNDIMAAFDRAIATESATTAAGAE